MKFAFSQKSRSLYVWNLLLGKQEFINTLNSLISLQQILFLLRTISHLYTLLDPPSQSISEESATNTVFYAINILKIPPKRPITYIWFRTFFLPTSYTLLKLKAYMSEYSVWDLRTVIFVLIVHCIINSQLFFAVQRMC